MLIADKFLDVTGYHAGKHHAESHESGTNGIVCGLLLSFAEKHHEKGKGCKSETVAELFDGDTRGDQPHFGRPSECEIHVHEVGEIHGGRHPPYPVFQALTSHENASEDTSDGEGDETDNSVYRADLNRA